MWGSHSFEAGAPAGTGEIIGLVAALAAVGLVVAAMVVSLRLRRRPREVSRAQAPPPYPEAGIAAEITAPGRVQRPGVEMEPGARVGME